MVLSPAPDKLLLGKSAIRNVVEPFSDSCVSLYLFARELSDIFEFVFLKKFECYVKKHMYFYLHIYISTDNP